VKVIQNFTASISRGEKIALIGRNGAGKTTMLKSLIRNATGFVEDEDRKFTIDSGEVLWDTKSRWDTSRRIIPSRFRTA